MDQKDQGRQHESDAAAPSLTSIARAAGVSPATVSRIVNGQVDRAAAETVARIRKLAKETGYRPNHAGRSLRRRESQIVAMLAPNIDNPAMAAIAASTEAALREAGFVMILCDTHDRADLQDEYLEAMRSQMARGYILVSTIASPGLEAAMRRGDPLVFVNRRNPIGDGSFVGIDNSRAGADAADYLLAKGRARLAVIYPDPLSSSVGERVEGFCSRCSERGAKKPRRAVGAGANHLEIGYNAIRRMVADGGWPDGLFCPSDLMAYAAFRLAHEMDIDVPHDCPIIGIDGNILNEWIAPWLSSIGVPYCEFGPVIVEELTARWKGAPFATRTLRHRPPA